MTPSPRLLRLATNIIVGLLVKRLVNGYNAVINWRTTSNSCTSQPAIVLLEKKEGDEFI